MSGVFPPETAASWRSVRRYAVPGQMIERATERRLAGDWRGACAAAGIDVAVDLDTVRNDHGAETAAALAEDLRHLVPDLVRWHLPRVLGGRSTLAPHTRTVLARYDTERDGDYYDDYEYCEDTSLYIQAPGMVDGPQRVRLAFGWHLQDAQYRNFHRTLQDWGGARHLWDSRRTGELLDRHGRPFLDSAGRRHAPDDPSLAERVALLHERGEIMAAFEAIGVTLDPAPSETQYSYRQYDPVRVLADAPAALTLLVPETRRLGGEAMIGFDYSVGLLIEADEDGARARMVDRSEYRTEVPELAEACWQRLPDLELVRGGHLTAGALHPLVRTALFPDHVAAPAGEPAIEPVRVRCKGEWHEVGFADGALALPHDAAERQREKALRALGGEVTGCFAAERSWRTGEGRLPKGLRERRRDLFTRLQHGDTSGVVALLDAGVDPHVLDGRRRTPLHLLHMVDFEPLLPRLLAAGLDLEARDQGGRTPLHMAVGDWGSVDLVRALIAAGARIDVTDELDVGLRQMIKRFKRTDLAFLHETLVRDHPDAGYTWYEDDE